MSLILSLTKRLDFVFSKLVGEVLLSLIIIIMIKKNYYEDLNIDLKKSGVRPTRWSIKQVFFRDSKQALKRYSMN